MVSPAAKLTGMAVCNHKVYGQMIAIVYAGGFTPNIQGKRALLARTKK